MVEASFTCENRDIKKAESILDEDRFQFSSSAEWIVVMVGTDLHQARM